MRPKRFDDFYAKDNEQFKQKDVLVDPGSGRAISLGQYDSGKAEPDFSFSFKPDMEDEMGIASTRLDIPEEKRYVVMLQLHNFGSKPCTVTIKRMRGK